MPPPGCRRAKPPQGTALRQEGGSGTWGGVGAGGRLGLPGAGVKEMIM